jgi:hypothetical protein
MPGAFWRDQESADSVGLFILHVHRISYDVTFFLLSDLRERLKQSLDSTSSELEDAIVRTIEAIPREALLDVFASWRSQVETCMQRDGDYFE